MKKFEPIAIIGQGCVLPGCFTPDDLWQMVYDNKVNIAPAGDKDWRVSMKDIVVPENGTDTGNKAWTNNGGYINGFDKHFDPKSFEIDSSTIEGLDPVFKWSFYAAQAALKDAGYDAKTIKEKTGLIMGNLSYPTRSMSKYFEEKHLERLFPEWKNPVKPTQSENRFMSGLPAILTAKAVGIKGEAYAIDAACASSLYALKLGYDQLISGKQDMMVIGGVCASDQLFLHVGFTALNALSPTGQSRPFNEGADGLIPSEGAGFIVIKKLKDAVKSKDNILGVIRGIGLSNDGKQGGFLSPAVDGQVRSMKQAIETADIDPKSVSYIECHATGTTTGDSIELKSMQEVYANAEKMHLGSLKGNVGHSITASGIGSIIKVLAAMRNKTLPPTPNAYPLNKSFVDTQFSITNHPTHWKSKVNRIAGISNFGFGGNNAHILVEEWNPKTKYKEDNQDIKKQKVAVVGIEIQTEKIANTEEYLRHLLGKKMISSEMKEITFNAKKLSSPPNDLKFTMSQQLLLLRTAENLLDKGIKLDKNSTGVFIGMGADAEVNRYGFRKRIGELLQAGGISGDLYDTSQLEETICPILNAPTVLGTMPNIPANRINHHFNFTGIGFTLSCEELSGIKALDVAISAIQNGELTNALVGAVDISNEFVHQQALAEALNNTKDTSDAAVTLVLKNYDKAIADGDVVLASIGDSESSNDSHSIDKSWVASKVGYSHASSGLIEVCTAVLLTHHRLQLSSDKSILKPILQNKNGFNYAIALNSQFGPTANITLHSEPIQEIRSRSTNLEFIHSYSAESMAELVQEIQKNNYSQEKKHRIGIVGSSEDLPKFKEQALKLLNLPDLKKGWLTPNIHYSDIRVEGEMAFAFTGAASAYPKMGKDLIEEFPALTTTLNPYCSNIAFAGDWIYEVNSEKAKLPYFQLAGSSFLSQIHSIFTKQILELKPEAVLGLSSGETNSMYAFGVWDDMDDLLQEIYDSELYTSALGVHFNAVKKHWDLPNDTKINWENWRVLASVDQVQQLLDDTDKVYMSIINTPKDCVIGGDKDACRKIINSFAPGKVMQLHHDIAIHCSAVSPYETEWRALHTRKVNEVTDYRFYSNYLDGVYKPTKSSVADALTGQAINAIDFPKIVNKAYADGVRIFVEHGPRNSLTLAIKDILKGKEFLALSMDKFGQSNLTEALRAATELWCAGVDLNLDSLLAKSKNISEDSLIEVSFPLHMTSITNDKIKKQTNISSVEINESKVMERAPQYAVPKRTQQIISTPAVLASAAPVKTRTDKTTMTVPVQIETISNTSTSSEQITEPVMESAPINSTYDLLRNQHEIMTQAHENFIALQLQNQKSYSDLMLNMSSQITEQLSITEEDESVFDEDSFTQQQVTEDIQQEQIFNTPVALEPAVVVTKKDVEKTRNKTSTIVKKTTKHEELPGPKFNREQLETLASGKISSVFGPLFEQQDQYAIQVRMPEPPLLLCDRVTGIKGEPGTLGLGTIYTETDVKEDSWYLHNNRMPPGIFIEAGQADLLLISYLGIDFQNKGERAYRLLGCELTFYGELPKPGDTLKYNIHVDGYAKSGDTTLFFFHYDCHINGELRISVRSGQAGFFSDKELEESKGVIWEAETAEYSKTPIPKFRNFTKKNKFSPAEIESYTKGKMVDCFGPELDWTQTHTRSPRSQSGYQNFIKNITSFDLKGGPSKRGYLRSETDVNPDDWYFKGHFKNDECMPGTLMADACLQMMAFYMVGAGYTAHTDGWRFEPVTETKSKFICRGQVTPASKKVVYEIFVDEIIDGDYPVIYAHVLASVDGNKAFLCERSGLRLVPDWPLKTMKHMIEPDVAGKKIANYKGFKFGYESLINCAWGNASEAFGPEINHYNGVIRSPRLPGPPYHFMTRIQDYKVEPGNYKNDPFVIAEYDVPSDAWYFDENGRATMPYGVLMEVALQPCGWFSTFICQYDIKDKDLVFRNLDGNAIQHRDITPEDKTIITHTKLTGVSIMGEIIIVKFDVISTVNGEKVFTMDTVFGFFDTQSMKSQKGLAIKDDERINIGQPNNYDVKLTSYPKKYFSESTACLPSSKLLMIDRVVALYPTGGRHGKGFIKAEKDVRKSEWFFKAHFFQDPVQPGSLGIEAMIQLMQFYMIDQNLHKDFKSPVFEPVAITEESEWHYRGQVTPEKKLITIDFELKETLKDEKGLRVFGEARLWVDGLKIYHAPRIGMRIREAKH